MDVAAKLPVIWKRIVLVFGDEQKALDWLQTPLAELDGKSPDEVLENDPATDAVAVLLDRIEYGVFS